MLATPGDESEARYVVERLFDTDRELDDSIDPPLFADLRTEAAEFRQELDLLDEMGLEVPVVEITDGLLASVALSLIVQPARAGQLYRAAGTDETFWARPSLPLRETLEADYAHGLARASDRIPGLRTIGRGDAEGSVIESAVAFARLRIAGLRELIDRQNDDQPIVAVRASPDDEGMPGCDFEVYTQTEDLRVFWSGAWRLDENYFGAPTSPARRAMLTGHYVFGVDGGQYSSGIQWDTLAVVTLPGPPQVHLNF